MAKITDGSQRKFAEHCIPMDGNQSTPGSAAQNEEFIRLFGLSQGRVFTYIATLLPCWADAEEVLQRTSIVLWQKFDQFDPSGSFLRWAYGVAYRQALKYLKQESRQRQVFREAVLEKLTRTHISYSDLLEKRHLAMDDCVAQLAKRPTNHRTLLLSREEDSGRSCEGARSSRRHHSSRAGPYSGVVRTLH